MHRRWAELIVLTVTGGAGLEAVGETAVSVCISDPSTPARVLKLNEALVSKIFQRSGVRIDWKNCSDAPEDTSTFAIHVIEHAPSSASPEALASTELSRSAITVFHDRVQRSLRRVHPAAKIVAPAFVIAHELGHAMQGIPRHSETGILKAVWTYDDFVAMLFDKLAFTDFDSDLIRKGLSSRHAQDRE